MSEARLIEQKNELRVVSETPLKPESSELKELLLVVRQALLMIVCFIEKKYKLERRM